MHKREFYDAKKAILLNSVDVANILFSKKVKSTGISKYFIGYLDGINNIVPLCFILPQVSGYIKYFENGGKNMPFKIEDDDVYIKYNQILNKIRVVRC